MTTETTLYGSVDKAKIEVAENVYALADSEDVFIKTGETKDGRSIGVVYCPAVI